MFLPFILKNNSSISLQQTKHFTLYFYRTSWVICIHCHQFLLSHSLFNLLWPSFCSLIPTNLSHKMINDLHVAQPKGDFTWYIGSIGQSWNSLLLGTISSLNFHDITISLFHTYALVIYSPILLSFSLSLFCCFLIIFLSLEITSAPEFRPWLLSLFYLNSYIWWVPKVWLWIVSDLHTNIQNSFLKPGPLLCSSLYLTICWFLHLND